MFPVVDPSQVENNSSGPSPAKSPNIEESLCNLGSVMGLRDAVRRGKHEGLSEMLVYIDCKLISHIELTEILQKHVFVGIVDINRCLSLIQHSTKLYLVNYGALS